MRELCENELLVVAGPNGSGKTTFAEELLLERACVCLSADRIASELAPHDPAAAQFAAGRELIRRINKQLESTEDFLVESTLSGLTFRRTLQRAKDAGFEISVLFVYLSSASTCVARVQERVRKGGHNVPEADVRRRYERSMKNFWQIYRGIADFWTLFYNGVNGFEEVAVGDRSLVSVREDDLFRQFVAMTSVENDD